MSSPTPVSEQAITQADLDKSLQEIQERDEELSFRAGKTVDHLNHLEIVDLEKKDELIKAINDLDVPRLKEHHVAKIVDIMPRSVKELALIISGYTLTVNKEYQEKIIETLQANA